MLLKILNISLIFIILMVFSACVKVYPPHQDPDCYIPEPECIRTSWDGMPLDTAKSLGDIQGYYYKIQKVEDLNSDFNDYQVSFNGDVDSYLTYEEDGVNRFRKAIRIENHIIRPKKLINYYDGHIGLASFSNSNSVFTMVPNFIDSEVEKRFREKTYNSDNTVRIPLDYIPGRSRIYSSIFDSDNFSEVKAVEFSDKLTNHDWESHPSLSPDASVMFFASTREGGFGSTDIWFVLKKENGEWGDPINAGPEINSPCDEFTPFIANHGSKLIFSSNGFDGIGGLDLFEIEIDNDFWTSHSTNSLKNRKNMRAPINTIADEWFPSSPFNTDSVLYYSSNQNNNNYDIYVKRKIWVKSLDPKTKTDIEVDVVEIDLNDEIDHNIPLIESPKAVDTIPVLEAPVFTPPSLIIEGDIIADNTGLPVEAEIVIKDLEDNKITVEEKTDDKGHYRIEIRKDHDLEIIAQNEDLFQQSTIITKEEFDTLTKVKLDFKLPIILTLRINFPYDVHDDPYKFTLDSLGNETLKSWFNEMDNIAANLMLSIDKVERIELVGHTDYIASQEYNQKLGLNRVKFVVKELVKRGIPEDKLKFRSAGELEPIPQRANESDELYRKRLRRVTINKILN